ncbi:MAG: FxsA family protein [Gammaproteobacteria bacterium]|nr:FxsA family protein [Gammaproteobacteria bacterium]
MRLLPVILVSVLAIPILEIYLLIEVGQSLGAITTIFFVVFTAVLGALLMRYQGLSNLQRVQNSMQAGDLPALEMMEGPVLLLGGVLLLVPGFLTDTLGFLLLFPLVRRALLRRFLSHSQYPPGVQPTTPPRKDDPNVIEGECHREDD